MPAPASNPAPQDQERPRRRSLRYLWRRRERVLMVGLSRVPAPVRDPVAASVAGAAGRFLDRRPGTRWLPQIAFGAHWLTGDHEGARALARRVGTSPDAHPQARRRLAAMAGDAGYQDVLQDIVRANADDAAPLFEAARARIARDDGRYSDALTHARAAVAGGVSSAASLVAQAEAWYTVTDPAWLPSLPGATAAARAAASPVPGRVLHIVAASLPYRQVGYTVRTQSVARCQTAVGLDPYVMTRSGFPGVDGMHGVLPEQVVDGIRYLYPDPDFNYRGRHDRRVARTADAALKLVARLRPAVLQPHANHLQAQAALAVRRETGIPVVYEVRGFWEESWAARREGDDEAAMATEHYRRTRDVETATMRASDAVVTLSETMRAEIIARGCDPGRVVIVPNAVDIERFSPLARDDALAAQLGLAPGDPVAGYITTFTAYEAIPGFLEAAALLRSSIPRLRILLVGEGTEEPAIRAAAARLGLDDGTLVMPGRVPHADIARYYSLIDVFVVPRTASRVSQLVTPLKPFEAMALERAVIVSDLPALREIVHPGETGETFRADDPADLARVLGGLLEDEGRRRRLGQNAREWILAERTWTANGTRYRELFERLGVT